MTIRKVVFEDVRMLVELRLDFLHELMRREPGDDTATLRKNLAAYFSGRIDSDEAVFLVAEEEGEIAATGGMVFNSLPPGYRMPNGRKGYILNMYTRPEHRRKGIAAEIIRQLTEIARKRGIDIVHLHAAPDGIAIYRRAGFHEPWEPELEISLPPPDTAGI
jgi:ribosomal protein S18 acetylase RimI-like enzyme